jgi:multidrug efflux pump subunit AcrB
MISLFAFIMALGIVVDDAIVVGENVYEHRQRGKPFLKAAVDGAFEVSTPVIFAILTSVAAFTPLLYVTGTIGKFIKVIPLVVISILVISLVECLLVLPAHLSFGKQTRPEKTLLGRLDTLRGKFGLLLTKFIKGPYRSFLQLSLHYRYTTVAVAICVLSITIGLVGGGIIKFRFMPKVAGNTVKANLEMISGTPASRTAIAQQHLFDTAMQTIEEFEKDRGEKIMRHAYSITGGTIARGGPRGGSSSQSTNLAGISLFLTPSEDRITSSAEIGRRWRELTGEIPGAHSLSFASNLVHMGANIDVRLAHESFDVLENASNQLQAVLANYPGVDDIASSYSLGKKELKIKLRPQARTLGITEEQLGRQLRSAFYGAEALRLQRGRNEVKVMVRYPEEDRRYLENLETMRIRTPNGGEIPLYQAALVEEGKGYSTIHRSDRKRVINITADVDSTKANAEEILQELKETILSDLKINYPGLGIDFEGETKERRDSMGSMGRGFMIALLVIYALLAVAFRSYSQPMLIMSAIPFGVIGAIFGHLIMRYDLSIMSMFGIVALSGVVVNDSLLLIDYANTCRKKGIDKLRAIIDAGTRRFRPILLTSLTTFFGLSPMILETSTQAKFLIPMAISLAFGIMAATGITLLLIPSLYLILEDFRHMLGFREEKHEKSEEAVR